jgi:hypothetical protein
MKRVEYKSEPMVIHPYNTFSDKRKKDVKDEDIKVCRDRRKD